jgi:SAM-dependent methyltransferase
MRRLTLTGSHANLARLNWVCSTANRRVGPSGAAKPVLAKCFLTMNSTHPCWCGETDLADFSPEYLLCQRCQTLVLKNWPEAEQFNVVDDDSDFYGRTYYESHLAREYGYPGLEKRARNDLNERCMHWMRTVLKYRLPPARALELGSAHGGFVALMRWAGFDASGLEISPWLVEYAKSTFGVPMFTGPIEKQNIEPRSLDLIVHFDVLEHLPDPRGAMRRCMALLKADGVMILQTPCFPVGRTHKEMVSGKDRFLEQFKPKEHLHLFSRESLTRLFSELGAPFLYFEQAIFDYYDMFAVASMRELTPHGEKEATEALLRTPEGRIIGALLDANAQYKELAAQYNELATQYRELAHLHKESEADRAARLQLLQEADAQIREIEARRKAIEEVLLKMDASYQLQMSHRLARLLRRLQSPLKMDALYKAMEERLASNSIVDEANGARKG